MSLHPVRRSQHPGPPPAPVAALEPVFGQGPRALRRSWAVATTLGETVGFLVPVAVALVAFDLAPVATLVLMVAAGAVEGLILGRAQAVVLRREFLAFPVWSWAGATAAGAGLAWLVGMLPSTFSGWSGWPLALTAPVAALLAAVLLTAVGGAQWLVLRHHLPRSRTWVPVTAVGWALGLGLLLAVTTPLWRDGQPTWVTAAVGVLGGLVMALTYALVTGAWLQRLARPHDPSATPPPGVPAASWARMSVSTDHFAVFDPGAVLGLPEPVQRWLLHSVAPGSALLTGYEALGRGQIRLGRDWRPVLFRQRSTLAAGFVWAGRTKMLGLPVTGYDRLERDVRDRDEAGDRSPTETAETAEMRWRLVRRVPLVTATGEETTRSSAGRHAAELLATVPAVALDPSVRWEEVDAKRAVAHLEVAGETHAMTVTVDTLGRLRRLEMDRWGTPPGSAYGLHRFGAVLGEERRFDGYLVPTDVVVGWHPGTAQWESGTFLRYRLLRCSFH